MDGLAEDLFLGAELRIEAIPGPVAAATRFGNGTWLGLPIRALDDERFDVTACKSFLFFREPDGDAIARVGRAGEDDHPLCASQRFSSSHKLVDGEVDAVARIE